MTAKYVVRDIERAVCLRFKLTPERLRGRERMRKIARPRQMAMYLARELTDASLPKIGAHFGRDHTTVIHACTKITAMVAEGGRMITYLAEVRAILERLTPMKQEIADAIGENGAVAVSLRPASPSRAQRAEGGDAVARSRAGEGRGGR
jgi:hypothetical protein